MNAVKALLAVWLASFSVVAAAQAVRELPDFTRLVDDQGNAVVNISTTQAPRRSGATPQVPWKTRKCSNSSATSSRASSRARRPPEARSLGSGFIISADGYILTNAHVVDGADEINVRFTDKREFKAKVIGADRRTDIAVIKIDSPQQLPAVKFGDPTKLKVGEWVVAIGSPFGFENTVTAGIVRQGRSLPQENFVPFIQTDVAINPGNSGGPLFNMRGEVVGINSQIYSRTGGFMGLSFAIPIDVALDIQKQLREKGRVARGRIGVVIQEVTRDLATSFGLDRPRGALVNSVEKEVLRTRRAWKRPTSSSPSTASRSRVLRPAAPSRLDSARLGLDARSVAQGQDAEAEHHSGRTAGRPRCRRDAGEAQAAGRSAG